MNVSDPKLDVLIRASARDLLDEDLELFHSIDTLKTKISDKAIKRIRRKIRNYDKESWWSSVPLAFRRAVAAVLVICSISFGFCMSVSAVRAEIVNTVMKWYDKFVSVFYVTEQTPPSLIEEYREPMLQLAGTERQIIMQSPIMNQIHYVAGNNIVVIYQQRVNAEQDNKIDSENECKQEQIRINESAGQLFTYADGRRTITWHDTEYVYILYAYTENIDVDTLRYIAESVK